MRQNIVHIKITLLLIIGFAFTANAQISNSQKKLLRDSLDYNKVNLTLNSKSNEFAPMPYKGGLLFVSNKPNGKSYVNYNKVYWVAESDLSKLDTSKMDAKYKIHLKNNDDFTPPTSNDNDILFHYKKVKEKEGVTDYATEFAHFSTNQAFAYNDSAKLIVYAKTHAGKIKGKSYWELWQANLVNGSLKNRKRILFLEMQADYLYPYLNNNADKLYFASNAPNGKGGYDLYYVNKNESGWDKTPIPLNNVNTEADEIAPFINNDSLFYSSNRVGGLGGFDVYASNNEKSTNLGYPINSANDDLGLKKLNNRYYLTSNNNEGFDIAALNYNTVFVPVVGNFSFYSDSSLLANQNILVKDIDDGAIVDTIHTDAAGSFIYKTRPNRNYEMIGTDGDGFKQSIFLNTEAAPNSNASVYVIPGLNKFKTNNKSNLQFQFAGRSPKMIRDSIANVLAKIEKAKKDSILNESLVDKFVVRYNFNKSTLNTNERLVLDSLINKLSHLPNAKVVIGSFTDCIGSYDYNYKLSVKRAKEVVAYLTKNKVDKKKIVLTGYSKKYNLSPCLTKYGKVNNTVKESLQISRRSEVVLSETTKTTWAKLEEERGPNYYAIYDANNLKKPVKLTPIAKPIVVAKKEVAVKVSPKVEVKPRVEVKPAVVVKKDTVVKVKAPVVVKKDTVVKVKTPVVVKKDTVAVKEIKSQKPVFDSAVNTNLKAAKQNIKTIVAKSTNLNQNQLSKEEIVKSLDSLAKLKLEQERIVNYLTLRINNKPIDVYVSSDSVTVEIYDNAVHDKDSVSVIYNSRIVVDRQELKVNKPIQFKLKVSKDSKLNELIIVAENLGSEPPNTAVMFITEKSGRQQQVILNTDMTHNGVVYFIRIAKE